jgi:hypothetical protein
MANCARRQSSHFGSCPTLSGACRINRCAVRRALCTQHYLDAAERSAGHGDPVRLDEPLNSKKASGARTFRAIVSSWN